VGNAGVVQRRVWIRHERHLDQRKGRVEGGQRQGSLGRLKRSGGEPQVKSTGLPGRQGGAAGRVHEGIAARIVLNGRLAQHNIVCRSVSERDGFYPALAQRVGAEIETGGREGQPRRNSTRRG